MKKIILALTCVAAIGMTTKAQQTEPSKTIGNYTAARTFLLVPTTTVLENKLTSASNGYDKDYNFYNRRSRNMRIAGLSLLGGGLVLGVSALLVSGNDYSTYSDSRDRTITTLFVLSAATGIASIPFMVLAHVNKSKARLAMKNQPTGFGVPANVHKNITGLTMSIPIGK